MLKPFLIITGMHRSGTSFLARALNLYGAYLGDLDSMISHDWNQYSDNLRGHWENKEFLELTEATLSLNNGRWDEIPDAVSISEELGNKISVCVKKISDHPSLAFGFKDPRILLFLDSWIPYLPKNLIIVGIFRNPLKVAESLKKRNQFSYEKSLNLWKTYNQNLLACLKNHDGFLLDFDWPKERIFNEINHIAQKIGLAKNIDLSEWYTEDLFHSDKTYESNYELPDEIKSLYNNLKGRSESNNVVEIKKQHHKSEELLSIIGRLLTEIQNQGNYFKKIQTNYPVSIKQRDELVSKLQNEFDENTKQILQLDKDLKQREYTINKLSFSIAEEKQQIQQQSILIKNMEEELIKIKSENMDLRIDISRTQYELATIKRSFIFKQLKKIAEFVDDTFPYGSKRREICRLAYESARIIRNQGPLIFIKAFKEKLRVSSLANKIDRKPLQESVPQIYLETKYIETDDNPQIISCGKTNEADKKLRTYLKVGSHEITNLIRKPLVTIIIPTFNAVDLLKSNLHSIENLTTYTNYEIIIVTNNLDPTSEMRKFLKTIKHKVLLFEEKYSFSSINNFAASKAKGDFLLFLNDDVKILQRNWIEALVKVGLDEEVGAVGGKLIFPNGKLQEAGCIVWKNGSAWNYGRNRDPNEPRYNFVRDVDYCSAACLLVKRSVFEKVGGFDARYEIAYSEDSDLCLSIKKSGFRVIYQPFAEVVHYEGGTQGTDVNKGIKAHQINNQKIFYAKWKSYLSDHRDGSEENSLLESNRKKGLNILYIDHYVPEYDKDAGSLTAFNFMNILSYMGHKVTFWPENLNHSEPYTTELQQKGIEVVYGPHNFEDFIKNRSHMYQVCIAARPHIAIHFIDKIKKHAPRCKIIYEASDLQYVRWFREANQTNDQGKLELALQSKTSEIKLMQNVDMVIFRSEKECQLALDENIKCKVAAVPLAVFNDQSIPNFYARKDLLFVGGFNHPPNIDAVKFFINEIFPLIQNSLHDTKFYVVGSNPTDEIAKLCISNNNCILVGYVPDISTYLDKCKVMVAPLRYGAGVKGKITQSMVYGLPVVTTSVGAEGISTKDDVLLISDDPSKFAKKVIELYTNKEKWENISNEAQKFANTQYSPESIRNVFGQIFKALLNPLT